MLNISPDLPFDTECIFAPTTSQFAAIAAEPVCNQSVPWRPSVAVLLPLNKWRDAVAGVPLINSANHNAVLLSTRADQLPNVIEQQILRLKPSGKGVFGEKLPAQVLLIGAIGTEVRKAVRRLGLTTKQIQGVNSLETAGEIAREMASSTPNPPAMLVPYNSPIDSQPVVALAAHSQAPILFVDHASIPEATSKALLDISPSAVYILGRNAKLSSALVTQVEALLPASLVIRIGGETITGFYKNLERYFDKVGILGWGKNKANGNILSFAAVGNIYQNIFSASLAHLDTHAPEWIISSSGSITNTL